MQRTHRVVQHATGLLLRTTELLAKVTLKNFQSHKNLELDLGNFTTLTGGSNGGKSAVLRAIVALVRNDSAGHYLRHGQQTLSVKLEFTDNYCVEWIKGSSTNQYILTDPEGNEQVFDKVGANVPEEVQAVLKLGPIIVGNDKEYINFHQQLEPPFLISATSGDVAKLFGELTSASQLYGAVGEGNRLVRQTNSQKTTRMSDLRKAKIDLEAFVDLDMQGEALDRIKNTLTLVESVVRKIAGIEKTVGDIEDLSSRIGSIEREQAGLLSTTNVSHEDIKRLKTLGLRVDSLGKLLDRHTWLTNNIDSGNNSLVYLKRAAGIDLSITSLTNAKVSSLSTSLSKVGLVEKQIGDLTKEINTCSDLLASLDRKIDVVLSTVEVCPHCKQSLTDHAKHELLGSTVGDYATS